MKEDYAQRKREERYHKKVAAKRKQSEAMRSETVQNKTKQSRLQLKNKKGYHYTYLFFYSFSIVQKSQVV